MLYNLLADLVLLLHLAFIVFVVLGGLLVARWPRLVWLHLPAVVWGALIEYIGWVCPLTPLENRLRRAGGAEGYEEGFIEHYLAPVIYPPGLTPEVGAILGSLVILINAAIYGWLWRRRRPA